LIFNLQIARALAAIGVVVYHIDYHLRPGLHTDFLGVATFFVLSGFIMCYITRDGAEGFLLHRIVRIVPLYWLCTFARIVILGGANIFHVSFWVDQSGEILRSLFFLPSEEPPLVAVGWTLNFEIYFYLIFAVSLMMSRRLAPLLAFSAVAAVMVIDRLLPGIFVAHYYSHGYIFFFLEGIGLFYLWRFAGTALPKRPVIFLCSAILVWAYGYQLVTPDIGWWAGSIPMLIVGSALFLASAGANPDIRPLVLLGDASYAIYLIHTLVMGSIRRIAPQVLELGRTDVRWFVALLVSCLLAGVALHLLVERPMLRLLRGRLVRRKSADTSIAAPQMMTAVGPDPVPSHGSQAGIAPSS
jgi:exopolysaccharide production protein ExoZ